MGEQVPNISEYVVGNVRAPESEQLDDLKIEPSYMSSKKYKIQKFVVRIRISYILIKKFTI